MSTEFYVAFGAILFVAVVNLWNAIDLTRQGKRIAKLEAVIDEMLGDTAPYNGEKQWDSANF